MAVKKYRRGQVFVLAAVLFTALFLLVAVPAGPSLQDSSGSDFQGFFKQSMDEYIDAFNGALSEDRSIDNIRRGLYSYNRFLQESASSRGIDFSGYQLAVLPEKGEAVLINYRYTSLDVSLSINGSWTNTTVEPRQYLEKSFTPGDTSVTLIAPNMDNRHEFSAWRPRIAYWTRMEGDGESWENTRVG